jgi:hypothetical protein
MRNLEIRYVRLEELTKYDQNTRKHSDKQLDQIARSMEEFGFTNPLLITENQMVIAGHGRLAAAELLGYEMVPTITIDQLTEDQIRAYVITDNQIALNAQWDLDLLAEQIELLDKNSFDLDLLGFGENELANMLLSDSEVTDPYKEWQDMPEFNQPDTQSFRHVVVHFDTPEDVETFFEVIGQKDTGKTKSVWFPEVSRNDTESKRYG